MSLHDPAIGIGLAAEHRKYVANHFYEYDVFIYHEDDILFKNSHLSAYLTETINLYKSDCIKDYSIGFQRYRRQLRASGSLQGNHFKEEDIFRQEYLEETPKFRPVCLKDFPFLVVEGNIHQVFMSYRMYSYELMSVYQYESIFNCRRCGS